MKTYKQLKENLLKKVNKGIDAVQVVGDVVGLADPTPITDLVNAGVSGVRAAVSKDPEERKDHLINAGLRGVSAIPYAGDAVGKTALAAKMGIKGVQAAKATKTASTVAKTTGAAAKTTGKTSQAVIKAEETALRKELVGADSATRKLINDKIQALQQKARDEARRQSQQRLGSNNEEEDSEEEV